MTAPDAERRESFCRKCGYNLIGLPSPRCPECGLEFDWDDLRTYVLITDEGADELPKALVALVMSVIFPFLALGVLSSSGRADAALTCAWLPVFLSLPVIGFVLAFVTIRSCRRLVMTRALPKARSRAVALAHGIAIGAMVCDVLSVLMLGTCLIFDRFL